MSFPVAMCFSLHCVKRTECHGVQWIELLPEFLDSNLPPNSSYTSQRWLLCVLRLLQVSIAWILYWLLCVPVNCSAACAAFFSPLHSFQGMLGLWLLLNKRPSKCETRGDEDSTEGDIWRNDVDNKAWTTGKKRRRFNNNNNNTNLHGTRVLKCLGLLDFQIVL